MFRFLLVAASVGAVGGVAGGIATWLALTAPPGPVGPRPDPIAPPASESRQPGVVVPLRVVA